MTKSNVRKPKGKRGGWHGKGRRKDGPIRAAGGTLLNRSALAEELKVTTAWISARMREADPIPHIRLPGSQRVLFRLPDVMAWISAHTSKPAPTLNRAQ